MHKKICIITSAHPIFSTRIFHKEAKTLIKIGYEVTLIVQHDKNEIKDGIKIIALPRPKNRFFRIFVTSWKAFNLALKQKANFYHFHDPELLPAGILLKLLTLKKVIYDVHEDYPQAIRTKPWLPPFFRGLIVSVFSSFELLLVRLLDSVIAATDDISHRFPEKKTITIKNYPILAFVRSAHSDAKIDIGFGRKGPTLIYAGAMAEKRGIYELVKALESIDEKYKVTLKLLGKFSDKAFERRVRSLKGFAKVDFLGRVPYEEVSEHLMAVDIGFVLFHPAPNHLKSMPNKLFEYMAAGLPFIASNFPLWKEILEENECGLTVDPLNPNQIARAIEYLLDHPGMRRKMSKNGQRAVREKYNWEKESEKLSELYQRLSE